MATGAKAAFGTTLAKGVTAIAELTVINGCDVTRDMIEATSHDSPDACKEYIAGLIDSGSVSMEGNLVASDAGQMALYTDLLDGSLDAYTITFPNTEASTWTFSALVEHFATTADHADKIAFSASLKISGKATFTV